MSKTADPPVEWPENFELSEFLVSGGRRFDPADCPPEVAQNLLALAWELQALRDHFKRPIYILSGWRPAEYNEQLRRRARRAGRKGPAKNSQHIQGTAADLVVRDHGPRDVADAIEVLIAAGKMKEGGLGRYPSWAHYDIRGHSARWGRN